MFTTPRIFLLRVFLREINYCANMTCYDTLAIKYVIFVTTFTDWYCLEPSKEQAAPLRASAQKCIFFALQAVEEEVEEDLVKGLLFHYETGEGQKLMLLSIQQLGVNSLPASRNCSVNSCRHLARFLSLQSMGLRPFPLKSKDKLLEVLYWFSYGNKSWHFILSLSQPGNIL